jgi:hypothetical protein
MGATVTGWRAPLRLVAISGAAVYVLVLVVLPFLEPHLDVRSAHPEDYANGAYGILVNLSYGALSLALLALVLALWPGRSWRAVGPLLFVPPAILCAALAVAPIAVAHSGTVVFVGILGLAVGPLVNSLVLRERFGRARGPLVGLGAAVLVGFIGLAAAPDSIGGAVNRGFDVLAGLWVGAGGYVNRE